MQTKAERQDDESSSTNADKKTGQAALADRAAFDDLRPETVTQRQNKDLASTGPRMVRQRMAESAIGRKTDGVVTAPNKTGLPDRLKDGIESRAGISMNVVQVHYNSSQPAQLNAHAYAHGDDIHIAPGQENHLPHEAWHVVQQKQGRVKPTSRLVGNIAVNDDENLEREADVMGDELNKADGSFDSQRSASFRELPADAVLQAKWLDDNENEYYKWDATVDGVQWFHHKKIDRMYFIVVDQGAAGSATLVHAGIGHSKSRSAWVELIGADTMIAEDASVEITGSQEIASKGDHEALLSQFLNLSSTGGLLMHAMAAGEEVESIGYLLDQDLTMKDIRAGEFKTKLLSYIRSDLSMKTFAFRKVGMLVDWKRIWEYVGYKGGKATIYPEDKQSSRNALDSAKSYGEAGGDRETLGQEFDSMARAQNELKLKDPISNWNEVLMFNAITAGVVGLLWIKEENDNQGEYDKFFRDGKKRDLYNAWFERTKMELMPIYIYTHMGNPKGGERPSALGRLGRKGASSLVLWEKYRPPV